MEEFPELHATIAVAVEERSPQVHSPNPVAQSWFRRGTLGLCTVLRGVHSGASRALPCCARLLLRPPLGVRNTALYMALALVDSPQFAPRFMRSCKYMFGAASPLQWNYTIIAAFTFASLLLLSFILHRRFKMMQSQNATPFPFLELPLELRTMVYNELVEDPYYPPPAPCTQTSNSLSWLMPGLFPPSPTAPSHGPQHQHHTKTKPSNWLFIANKQTYNEYMAIVCKKATFHFTVSPQNYPGPTAPAADAQVGEEQPTENRRLWDISPEILKHLHKCDLKLITTSAMLGIADPRNMQPGDWALADKIKEELSEISNVTELNLQVKAIGDPLWNPLWVWYHASQSLKNMGTTESSSGSTGPKLNRITFSLDTWSPGENLLERDADHDGQWMWKCLHNHCVAPDGPGEVSVREFCARLYMDCPACRPAWMDEEDGGAN
jgi:hypothetical protein